MWVIADEFAKLGLTFHFVAPKVFNSPPHTVIMAMSVKSLCLSAHISNVLKISYMKLSKSNYVILHIREKTSSHIPLEKELISCVYHKTFFKYFSRCDNPWLIDRVTWLLFTPSALAIAVLLIPKK